MALFRVYIAASLDGFIADRGGGVEWLGEYTGDPELDFPGFLARIGTVVMGRTTYDQARTFEEWPYAGKRVVVLTNRPLEAVPGEEVWRGPVRPLAERLRAETKGKDIWLVGGSKTVRAFLDEDLVDRLEVYVIPLLLGDGIPLFERSERAHHLALERTRAFNNGIVELVYGVAAS